MKITKENLNQAIGALKQCSRENKSRNTDTGNIRISDLCDDLVTYLEEIRFVYIVIKSEDNSIASQIYSTYEDAEKFWMTQLQGSNLYRILTLRIV